jgi:hypothetical protein
MLKISYPSKYIPTSSSIIILRPNTTHHKEESKNTKHKSNINY